LFYDQLNARRRAVLPRLVLLMWLDAVGDVCPELHEQQGAREQQALDFDLIHE
jgi:hypothetical protein